MMVDDYQDAAKRHWHDAQILHRQNPARLANASHLYGISAECSLKAMVRHRNPTANFLGSRGHMPKLFSELKNLSVIGSNLIAAIQKIEPDFSGWDVSQRYENQSDTRFATDVITRQQSGAQKADQLMNNVLGGLV